MSTKQVGPIQFQGKLGTIVGRATRKGTMSLGMAPTKYTNTQSPKQVWARARFLAVQTFVSHVPRAAFAGLARSAQSGKMSLANMAFKLNTKIQNGVGESSSLWQEPHVEAGGSVLAVMDKTALKFSKGTTVLTSSKLNVDTPQHVKFTLNHDFETAVDERNMIYHAIVYCPDANEFRHFEQGGESTSNEFDITLPELWNGLKVFVYAYAQYWGDNVDFTYNPISATSASALFVAENAKTESTETLFVGQADLG